MPSMTSIEYISMEHPIFGKATLNCGSRANRVASGFSEKGSEVNCPVCGSDRTKAVYTGCDKTVSTAVAAYVLSLRLARCRACGMRFLDNTDYDLDKVHDLYWKMMVDNVPEGHSVEIEKVREYLVRDLGSFRTTGSLLEIGCGEGEFLKVATENGWQTTGIEVSESAAQTAREKHGLDVLTGTIEQHQDRLAPGSFDVVVLWGLVEHVRNPGELLRTARRLVRSGGAVLLYTPNADSIFHRLAGTAHRVSFGLLRGPMECVIIAMHPMYFTLATLGRLLGDNGFLVESTEMADIDLDLVFKFYRKSWWANGLLLAAARLLQLATWALPGWRSHMVVLARAV